MARPVEPRPHGAHRNTDGRRDLLIGKLRPGKEQKHLPVAVGQARERRGQRRRRGTGVDSTANVLVLVTRLDMRTCIGPEPALLRAPVVAQQIDRDPVQPSARLPACRVINGPPVVGLKERLRGELIGDRRLYPPPEIPANRVVVAIKQVGEVHALLLPEAPAAVHAHRIVPAPARD